MTQNTAGTVTAPLGARYEVSGGGMLLHRSGAGGTPVVFLAGGGMFGLYYRTAHDLVAEFTTSVFYDRLGLGWSDAVALPRTGRQVTDDLHELLRVSGVHGPCVLVGHSLGGLYARFFAKRFPHDVAGLVLLDPTHEDILDHLPENDAQRLRDAETTEPPSEQVDAMRHQYRVAFGRALADWPADIRDPLLDRAFSRGGFRQSLREPISISHLFDEAHDSGPDPDVPWILLSAMGTDTVADELTPAEARVSLAERNQRKQQFYTALSAAHSRAEIRRLDDAGHSGIAWQRPDAIAQAVRDTLAR